jgi:hypothetical protein
VRQNALHIFWLHNIWTKHHCNVHSVHLAAFTVQLKSRSWVGIRFATWSKRFCAHEEGVIAKILPSPTFNQIAAYPEIARTYQWLSTNLVAKTPVRWCPR